MQDAARTPDGRAFQQRLSAAIARIDAIPRGRPLFGPLNNEIVELRKFATTQVEWNQAKASISASFDRRNRTGEYSAGQLRNMIEQAELLPLRSNGYIREDDANTKAQQFEPPANHSTPPELEPSPQPDSQDYDLNELGTELRQALKRATASLVTAKRDTVQVLKTVRAGASALVEFDFAPGFDIAIAHLQAVARDHYSLSVDDIQTQISAGIDDALERRARDQAKRSSKQQRQQERGAANDTKVGTLESAKASTYKLRAIRWFWPNRFALGKFGIIGGMPDRGKGQIAANMISNATRGGAWPCNEGRAVKGSAILLTAEDDIEDTVNPRLLAADADLDRVHIVNMVRHTDGSKRMFSLVSDLELLRQKIKEIGDVVLVVIDPVSAYMGVGKIDSYRTTDVRGVLGPLKDLAEETMVSIVGVMHFNKKNDVREVMLRIADSLAYVAAARHCYVVVDDAENARRLFVKAKNNVAVDVAAISYTVDTKYVGDDEETGERVYAPYVVWGSDHVTITATEAMEAEAGKSNNNAPSSQLEVAKEFLSRTLAIGPVLKSEIDDAAKANCISERTLARAKSELSVVAKKGGFKEGWVWELPPPPQSDRRHD